MTLKSVDEVLEAMLDAVIDVSGAEKGLILLLDDAGETRKEDAPAEDGTPSARSKLRIRASRNVHREGVSETAISDSIVQRVLRQDGPSS